MEWLDNLKQKLLVPRGLRDENDLDDTVRDYAARVEKACAMTDPAERLFAALDVKESLERHAERIAYDMSERAGNVSGGFYLTTMLGGVGTGLAVASLLNPIVGFSILGVGVVIGFADLVTNKSGDIVESHTMNYLKPHIDKIDALHVKAQDTVNELLEKNTVAIAASPKFKGIYDRFPEIRDHFNVAFNQAAAKQVLEDTAAQQPKPAQPGTGLQL